jgi:hypothetical protein
MRLLIAEASAVALRQVPAERISQKTRRVQHMRLPPATWLHGLSKNDQANIVTARRQAIIRSGTRLGVSDYWPLTSHPPAAARSGEGHLTQPTAAAQLWEREPIFMPVSDIRPGRMKSSRLPGA